ncbi:MAG: LPS-assembly protein LptD [Spirochaetaceae bacterium]|jgi:hypothetical protein|nr:LPS-assembly protein LptD [Spirochaetaceae bacterium]
MIKRGRPAVCAAIVLLAASLPFRLFAQENTSIEDAPAGMEAAPSPEAMTPAETAEDGGAAVEQMPPEPELTPEQKIFDMDIRTSSLIELAAWCRSLGLSEGGNRDSLAARLREYYGIVLPPAAETAKEQRIITIESARLTEYFTLTELDEEYARLRGEVRISLREGEATHRIEAEEILYNRTRNMMTASGNVYYVKEDGDTTETFRGETITVDLDNWSGVFANSVSERAVSGDETAYRFAGKLISRTGEDTTVLSGAVITNAGTDEPFWSISASKLWLLPGSDFAIVNVVLKVGEIPLLWLPAFFWPSDEVVFHPVLGTRTREGSFLQTTTYILGRPKTAATESSITKILGSSAGMEQEREGIFLRSTGRRRRDTNAARLSVLLDVYTNLGAFMGVDLGLPAKAPLGAIELFAGVGLSRNIYPPGSGFSSHTPFPNLDGESEWNSARFFSVTLPVRYRFKFSGSIAGQPGSFSWNFPYYSDPLVDRDFMNRSESMDFMKMLQQGSAQDTTSEISPLGNYSWQLSGSLNPRIEWLAPFVTDFHFSSISSSLEFGQISRSPLPPSIAPGKTIPSDSPDALFYFPRHLSIMSVSAVIRGTPVQTGQSPARGAPAGNENGEKREDPLFGIGTVPSPFETPSADGVVPGGSAAADTPGAGNTDAALRPEALSARFDLPRTGNMALSWTYQLNPSFSSNLDFGYSAWREPDDVSWSDVASVLTGVKTDGNTAITLNDSGAGFYDFSVRANGNLAWQDYSYMDDAAVNFNTVDKRNDAWRRVYSSRAFSTFGETSLTLKPLYWNSVLSGTSVQYSLRGLVAKSAYRAPAIVPGSPIEDPVYDVEWGGWTKERIELHQTALYFSASIMDKLQTLSLVTELPPRDMAVTGTATFRAWVSETTLRERIIEPFDDTKRIFEPLTITETLRFASRYYFQQSLTYDPELDDFTWLSSSLVLAGFSATYSMSRAATYSLSNASGRYTWITGPVSFSPREFRLGYAESFKKNAFIWDWLSVDLNISTALTMDLQRYTSSRFNFDLRLSLSITKFLDLSISTSSANDRVFRYFQDLPFFDFPLTLPGETNILLDLLNSFRFDDEALRRSSGFKLKSFTLSAAHYMGDWTAKLGVTLTPYLDAAAGQYSFNTQITFLVQWVPIPEIKLDSIYDKEIWQTR